MSDRTQVGLPSKKSVDDSIRVIEDFRELCRFQMDLGYRSTIDFPSKHHINRILHLSYRSRSDLLVEYGEGLVRHIYDITPSCRAYIAFLKGQDPHYTKQEENPKNVENNKV